LRVDANGDLRIRIGGEEFVQQLPVVYQKAGESIRLISGEYKLTGGDQVAFDLGPYDRREDLVIDPVVLYSGFVSASGSDTAVSVQRDAEGFLYIAGNTRATGLPVSGNAYQASNGGEQDIFVMKVSPYATSPDDIVYLAYIGGTGVDEVKAMVMTDPGLLYLTGWTVSSNFPVSSGAAQSTLKGDKDAFFMKLDLNQDGTAALQYSTFFGGTGADVSNAITVDSAGNAIIAGYSGSGDVTMTSDAVQAYGGGGWDAFAVMFNPSGTITYSTFLGGDKTDIAQAVAVAPSGAIIIAGSTMSVGFPLAGASFDANYHDGGGDAFIARIIPNKGLDGLQYATFLGGDGADEIRAMAFNAKGQLVLAGSTSSDDFPVGQGALQTKRRGASDLFVTVMDLDRPQGAALIYSTYLGGSDTDIPYGISFDNTGKLLLTGYTYSTDFPVTGGAFQSTLSGSADAFLAKLDLSLPGAAGLVYASFLGGVQADIGYALTSDNSGNIYTVGATKSRRFPMSAGERAGSYPGDYDGFVFALQPCSVTLSPSSNSVPAAGGDYQLLVTSGSECTWNVSPTADWIVVKDAGSGKGNGTVVYTVAPNDSGDSRTAALLVTNQKRTVTQAAQ
jgi:hypothetical protein